MRLADQLDLLHTWLAEHSRPAGVSVSAYLQSCAAAGDDEARRILASDLYTSTGKDAETPEPPAQVPPAVIDRNRRLASQQLPSVRNMTQPRRPIVHSGETRAWLTK